MSQNIASITLTYAKSDRDIEQILALQQRNLKTNISDEVKEQQGFLTVCHTRQQLELMRDSTPQVIATADGNVIAFALAMLPSSAKLIPDLQPMFEICDNIPWNGRLVGHHPYYVMGQICVDEPFRRQGVFDKLYDMHKTLYSPNYDLCITEISTSNKRSQRAHERVGFETIHVHKDHVDEWNVVGWKLRE